MDLISIIDLGTGSIRNTVYNLHGNVVGVQKSNNTVIHPYPNWAEQDPLEWWKLIKDQYHAMDPDMRKQIIAISVTSQREGIVPVDKDFQALGNMIIWLDGRTIQEGEEIVEKIGKKAIYDITGLVPNPAWSLSKILWLRKHEPEVYKKTYKFLQAEDYLLSRLSKKAVTEVSIASRTCLMDVHHRQWSSQIMKAFDIEEDKLPELLEPGTLIGLLPSDIADELRLTENIKIFTGAGDQQAAALGVGALEEGMASIGIGTSSAISMTLDQPVSEHEHNIILNCAAIPGKWEYEPPIWNTGGLVRWFVENVQGNDMSYEELLTGAEKVPMGCDGLIALPYFSGAGSPRWNPRLKGGFYGLGLHHKDVHLLRSLMESIAFEIKFNIEAIRSSGILLKKVILSGGASQNKPLCQIISDVLQSELEVFIEAEASSRGVFLLVKGAIEAGPGSESAELEKPEYLTFMPDPQKKDHCEKAYERYIRLGDLLEGFTD